MEEERTEAMTHIEILDENGELVSTVPVQSQDPRLIGAIVFNLRTVIKPGYQVPYDGDASWEMGREMFY